MVEWLLGLIGDVNGCCSTDADASRRLVIHLPPFSPIRVWSLSLYIYLHSGENFWNLVNSL